MEASHESVSVGRALVRQVRQKAESAGNRVLGVLESALSTSMPYIEFDMNAFSMEAALEDGPIGIFTKQWPGHPCPGSPHYVYSRAEAMAWIAALPKEQITRRGRLFLRLQVHGSGLE